MPKYTNELFTAFTGKVNSSFTESIKKVNTELTGLGKSAETVSKRFKKVDIGKMNSQMQNGAKSANSYSLALDNVGRAIQVIATFQLASSVIGGITGALSSGTDALIKYDQALKNLQAITGASAGEVEVLGDTILNVSNSTKFSAEEVANAAVVLGQAGFTAAETIQSLEAVASLATGTLSDFKTTADLMATTLRAFELQASDSARVADIFAVSVNRSKLNIQDLRTILGYIGKVAHTAGLSLEETAGAVQLLKNQGIKASTVATGFRNVLSKMLAPTAKLKRAMGELGIELKDINPSVVGIEQAFKNILPLLRDGETGAIDAGKAFELFQLRGAQTALIMSQMANSGDFARVVELTKEQGAAAAQQAKQQEGLEIQLKNLSDRWKNVMVLLGDAGATKIISGLVTAFSELGLALQEVISGYIKLEEYVGRSLATGVYRTRYVMQTYKAEKVRTEQLLKQADALRKLAEQEDRGADITSRRLKLVNQLKSQAPELSTYVDAYYDDLTKLADFISINASDSLEKASKATEDHATELTSRLATVREEISQIKSEMAAPIEEGAWADFKRGFSETTRLLVGANSPKEALAELRKAEVELLAAISEVKTATAEPLEIDTADVQNKVTKVFTLFTSLGKKWEQEAARLQRIGDYVGLDTLLSKAKSTDSTIDNLIDTMHLSGEVAAQVKKSLSDAGYLEYKKSIDKATESVWKITRAEKDRIKSINTTYKGQRDILKETTAARINTIKEEEQLSNSRIINEKNNAAELVKLKLASAEQQRQIEIRSIQESYRLEQERLRTLIDMREKALVERGVGDPLGDEYLNQLMTQLLDVGTETEATLDKIGTEYDQLNAKLSVDLQKALEKNPDTFARAWTNAIRHVNEQADSDFTNIQDKITEVTDDIGDGLTDSIVDFANGTKTAKDSFADMAKSILADIQKMIVKMLVMKAIGSVMGMFGGGSVSGMTGQGGGILSGLSVAQSHSGGTIGAANPSTIHKTIDPSMFVNAPRFHSGGEVAAVLQEGEYVQTREDRLRSKDQGGTINIEIKNESGQDIGATKATSSTTSMGDQVITIWLDALHRNKGGVRTAIQGIR